MARVIETSLMFLERIGPFVTGLSFISIVTAVGSGLGQGNGLDWWWLGSSIGGFVGGLILWELPGVFLDVILRNNPVHDPERG